MLMESLVHFWKESWRKLEATNWLQNGTFKNVFVPEKTDNTWKESLQQKKNKIPREWFKDYEMFLSENNLSVGPSSLTRFINKANDQENESHESNFLESTDGSDFSEEEKMDVVLLSSQQTLPSQIPDVGWRSQIKSLCVSFADSNVFSSWNTHPKSQSKI